MLEVFEPQCSKASVLQLDVLDLTCQQRWAPREWPALTRSWSTTSRSGSEYSCCAEDRYIPEGQPCLDLQSKRESTIPSGTRRYTGVKSARTKQRQ